MTKVATTSPNGEEVRDMTADELAQLEKDKVSGAKMDSDIQSKIDLKASAKAKLIAGEALTEDEANILTGV